MLFLVTNTIVYNIYQINYTQISRYYLAYSTIKYVQLMTSYYRRPEYINPLVFWREIEEEGGD